MDRDTFDEIIKKQPFAALNDLVYNFLFENIINIKLNPNQRISETEIANKLGISRSPVKMAIERLIDERLIVKHDNKTLCVAPLDVNDYYDICDARQMLEGTAAFYAAKQITKAELNELKRLVDEYALLFTSSSLENFEIVDHSFHTFIVNASHNNYIIDMYNSIQNLILRYRYNIRHSLGENYIHNEFKNNPKSHYAIYSAIKTGYSSVAKSEMELHISQGMFHVLSKV
jgi:GntR family transcriptional regulator, rspAB operon transcriptional repressor